MEEYYDNYNILINSSLISIENTTDPFSYKFKTRISSVKGDYSFDNVISSDVDCINLKDPVPLLFCKGHNGLNWNDTDYRYGNSLSEFLKSKGVENYSFYENASSPLIVKKCPYDPYVHHGDPGVLRDCLDTGYFHESADGSCYLCRLEGKGKCPHYGMEVFIQTHTPLGNESLSCSDHVVFADHYNGEKIDPDDWDSLILDSSHRKKYGLWEDGQ